MNCIETISGIKKGGIEKTIEKTIEISNLIIKTLKIKKIPIPIVKIIDDLGFFIYVVDLKVDFANDSLSGFISIGEETKNIFGNDKVICISKNEPIEMQRFILAHEFAHYLFDFNEQGETTFFNTFDTEKSDTEEEQIPSRFAAELLMPSNIFTRRYNELSKLTQYEKINALSDEFNTPQKSVIKRFGELNLK